MKKVIVALIVLIVLGGGYYFLKSKTFISDDGAIFSFPQNGQQTVARADLNGDGVDDEVVGVTSCGASCSHKVEVIINSNAGPQNIGSLVPKVPLEVDPRNIHSVSVDRGIITIEFADLSGEVSHVGKYKVVDNKIITLQ